MTRRKRKCVHVPIVTRRGKVYALGVFFDKSVAANLCRRWVQKFPESKVAVDSFIIDDERFEEAVMLSEE